MSDSRATVRPAPSMWDETTRKRVSAGLYLAFMLAAGAYAAVTGQFESWRIAAFGAVLALSYGVGKLVVPEQYQGTALYYGLFSGIIVASWTWVTGAGVVKTVWTFGFFLVLGTLQSVDFE